MRRIIALCIAIGIIVPWSISGETLQSTNYNVQVSVVDSGGRASSSAGYQVNFQSAAPVVTGITTSATRKMVNGTHFSSFVAGIGGYVPPVEKDDVPLTASVYGTLTSQVEFNVRVNGGSTIPISPASVDSTPADGWGLTWQSQTDIPSTGNVDILARANDGLTWGPWFEVTNAVFVDHASPAIQNFVFGPTPFSPNGSSSVGVRDTTSFAFNIIEDQLDNWEINILRNAALIRSFSGTTTAVDISWNGLGSTGNPVVEGVYDYEITVKDTINNETVTTGSILVDNTEPDKAEILLAATGTVAKNTQLGNVNANWTSTDNFDTNILFDVAYAVQTFTPRSVSGLALWLDANDPSGTGFLPADGTLISTWVNKKSPANSAVQATGSKQPVFHRFGYDGKPVITFDGTDDVLRITDSSFLETPAAITVFVVARHHTVKHQFIVSKQENGGWGILSRVDGRGEASFHVGGAYRVVNSTVALPSGGYVLSGMYDGSSVSFYVDGAAQGTPVTGLSGPVGPSVESVEIGNNPGNANHFDGEVAEVLVYERALTLVERQNVENYLIRKWVNPALLTWNSELADTPLVAWSKSNVDDNADYTLRVISKDDAGNLSTVFSNIARTPDRTAPVMDAGFTEITGLEDINWTYSLAPVKSDETSEAAGLTWNVQIITNAMNPALFTDSLLITATVTNNGTVDPLAFTLYPNANSGENTDGNIYGIGPNNAQIALTLTDEAGNYSTRNININVLPVNDKPVFESLVASPSVVTIAPNLVIYNFFTLEDQTAPTINLDDFVSDVDDLKSSLAFSITGASTPGSPNYYTEVSNTLYFGGEYERVFESNDMIVGIGYPISNHKLILQPKTDWYGDEVLTINVTDGDTIPTEDRQKVIVRVWPVNDAPIIGGTFQASHTQDEDTGLVYNLEPHGTDKEDSLANLTWTVASNSIDTLYIDTLTTDNKILSVLPLAEKYGTTSVTVQLKDTDMLTPFLLYPDAPHPYSQYVPEPKTTTAAVTLVWTPVNDPPVIVGTIPGREADEDLSLQTIDLAPFESDIEDNGAQLVWTHVNDNPDLVSVSIQPDKTVILTPQPNAWGSATVTFRLTDSDNNILFDPYSPDPKYMEQSITVTLNAVNDSPSISSIDMIGANSTDPFMLLSTDLVTVSANGFTDVGYVNGNRDSGANGDEYVSSEPDFGFTGNSKLYNYRWRVISDNVVVQEVTNYNTLASLDTFSITPALEGVTINVAVWPGDGIATGNLMEQSMKVNIRPATVVVSTPESDTITSKNAMAVTWNATQDPDDGAVGYRLKIWKVPNRFSPPPIEPVTADVVSGGGYDSGWIEGNFLGINHVVTQNVFADGSYYWRVYSGNKFDPNVWDHREPPLGQMRSFHIDTVGPQLPTPDILVNVDELTTGNQTIGSGGTNTLLLYGQKPSIIEDDVQYSVWLEMFNERIENGVTVNEYDFFEIVPATTTSNWTYLLTYPEGRSTYNIWIRDLALNNSVLTHTFFIEQDLTPPPAPSIAGVLNGAYNAITSANYYQIIGTKETGSSLFYDGIQLVGYTGQEEFAFLIWPEKPSGNLTAKDRAGNVSPTISVGIEFFIGPPQMAVGGQSRVTMNSESNTEFVQTLSTLGLSALQNDLSEVVVTWSAQRQLTSYRLRANNQTILSGGVVPTGQIVTSIIEGNHAALTEGLNTIEIQGWDRANNQGSATFTIARKTTKPSTFVINLGMVQTFSNRYRVTIIGKQQPDVTVFINGSTGNVTVNQDGTWQYVNTNYDLANQDITLTVQDSVYNRDSRIVWDHNQFASYTNKNDISISSFDNILLSYDSLPESVSKLYSAKVNKDTLSTTAVGFSVLQLDGAISPASRGTDVVIPAYLEKEMYQLYAKSAAGQVFTDISLAGNNVKVGVPLPAGPIPNTENIRLVHYNEEKQKWEDSGIEQHLSGLGTIEAVVHKAGLWRLAEMRPFATDLTTLQVYPNPWIPEDGNPDTGTLLTGITFDNLTTDSTVRIFTISGQLVRQSHGGDISWVWDGKNESGQDVFSGVYLYIVTDGNEKKTGKITIIR